jgi:hypothetical protein
MEGFDQNAAVVSHAAAAVNCELFFIIEIGLLLN